MLLGLSTALVTAIALTLLPIKPTNTPGARKLHVALVDALSVPSARAEVVRFSEERPDLILLRSSTVKRDDLVAALATHERVRGRRPDRPGLIARTTIVGHGPAAGAGVQTARRAEAILRQLKASPPTRIGNLGRGRWGEFDAAP
jgi:hypothetical protein